MSKEKKEETALHGVAFAVAVFLALLLIPFALAPPSPHNVQGRVFTDTGSTGVPNGIPVRLNNTNATNIMVYTQVSAPPAPQFRGSYSATINGSDLDTIEAWAWNSTHYGYNRTNLSSTTTQLNIVLSVLRPSRSEEHTS